MSTLAPIGISSFLGNFFIVLGTHPLHIISWGGAHPGVAVAGPFLRVGIRGGLTSRSDPESHGYAQAYSHRELLSRAKPCRAVPDGVNQSINGIIQASELIVQSATDIAQNCA